MAAESSRALSVLVAGCGSIGMRHLANLRMLGVGDVFVYDTSDARAAEAASSHGASAVRSLDEAWARQPDIVFVTVPSHLHVPIAREAGRRGAHLFIEKPLSASLDGVDALIDETRAVVTMVGCNMRFHPGPRRVKELIDTGAIGTVLTARIFTASYLPTWRPGTDYRTSYSASAEQGGGAILDCIHEIDLALWYLGAGRLAGAASISAVELGIDVEGAAEILIRHDSGALSNVHLSIVQRDYRRGCEIAGTDGSIRWTFGEPGIIVSESPHATSSRLDDGWSVNDMFRDEAAYFLDCVARKMQTFNTLTDARRTLALALQAREVARRHPAARIA